MAGSAVWRLTLVFAVPLIVAIGLLATSAYVLMVRADTAAVKERIADDALSLKSLLSPQTDDLWRETEIDAGIQARKSSRDAKIVQSGHRLDVKAIQVAYIYVDPAGKLKKLNNAPIGDDVFAISHKPWCPWWSFNDDAQCSPGSAKTANASRWYLTETKTHQAWGLARRFDAGSYGYLYVARKFALVETERAFFTVACWALVGAGLALAVGFLVSRQMLRRVERVNAVCDRVVRGDWSARAAGADAQDEFGALSRHVNGMLEHIDALILGMSRVSDFVSHDLRAPIAALKKNLEAAAEASDLEETRDGLEAAIDHAEGIRNTFETLMEINEAEAGGGGRLEPMRLDEAARAIVDTFAPVAEVSGLTLTCETEPAPMLGKRLQIERLVVNLLENAIKYSTSGGEVRVTVARRGEEAILSVADRGPGIPAEEREAMMARGARGEATRAIEGHGMGLSIVKLVAMSHGAKLRMDDAHPGLIVSVPFKAF